jgi:hypothetical protein
MIGKHKMLYRRLKSIRKEQDSYITSRFPGGNKISYAVAAAGAEAQRTGNIPLSCRSPDIEKILEQKVETFSVMLLRLIDEKGMKDSAVYKNENIVLDDYGEGTLSK